MNLQNTWFPTDTFPTLTHTTPHHSTPQHTTPHQATHVSAAQEGKPRLPQHVALSPRRAEVNDYRYRPRALHTHAHSLTALPLVCSPNTLGFATASLASSQIQETNVPSAPASSPLTPGLRLARVAGLSCNSIPGLSPARRDCDPYAGTVVEMLLPFRAQKP